MDGMIVEAENSRFGLGGTATSRMSTSSLLAVSVA